MDVTIEQSCPSCGASIVINEDDSLIRCAYCDVYNYKLAGVGNRYVLPSNLPDHVEEDQLVFAPYLRFKGSIFYVRGQEVRYKIVDTTRLGLKDLQLPVSLGLRAQTMKIKPVVAATRGAFIPQSIATKTVFAQAARIIDLLNDPGESATYHRAFIGETLSQIYQPCYVKDGQLVDAISKQIVGPRSLFEKSLASASASKVAWEPRFIAAFCPVCAGLLAGERDSMVLQCKNCQSLWQEHKGRFVPVAWQVVPSGESKVRYLPFWRITLATRGYVLQSFGDYLRFTNQPLIRLPQYDDSPLAFWIPAFKINPKAFLQIASQLTVAQMRIPEGQRGWVTTGHPVTLELQEAHQAVKSVLANTTLSRERHFPLLPKIQPGDFHGVLAFLPFVVQTHDLVQEHSLATIQTAALRYGRAL